MLYANGRMVTTTWKPFSIRCHYMMRWKWSIGQSAIGNQQIPDSSGVSLITSGLTVQGNTEDNLCIKAYNLLKKDHPQLGDVDTVSA